jgi:methyl acetate hydrolase
MSPTTFSLSPVFQSFLDDAVAKGVAPGFQCVVFDRDSLVFNGVSGLASAPTDAAPEGKPFKPETLVWLASCTKICISLIVLHIIERNLTKSGFAIQDLDSHEALVKVLPEFKHGSGSLVTKIIEGFEDEVGKDGKKVMKLRDAKGRVTLRMLLTHTAGMALYWNHPHMTELVSMLSDGYETSDTSLSFSTDPQMAARPTLRYLSSTETLGISKSHLSLSLIRPIRKLDVLEGN